MDVEVKRVEVTMTVTDAAKLHKRIVKGIGKASQCWTLLRELIWEYDNGGWKAMGYNSLHHAFQKELRKQLDFSKTTLYRLLKRGEVVESLSLSDGTYKVDEAALDQFAKLSEDHAVQKQAFADARLLVGVNPVSASQARKVVSKTVITTTTEKPKEKSSRVTIGERAFNIVRDLDHVISEVKRLKGPGLEDLHSALAELKKWMTSHQEGEST